jgi:hypothetical protein
MALDLSMIETVSTMRGTADQMDGCQKINEERTSSVVSTDDERAGLRARE